MIGFIMLFPLFGLIVILLFFANKGKLFFKQLRPGKNEKAFWLIKFKTMSDKKDSKGELLPDEKRLTIVGSIIRKTTMDEIPRLLNVIKGDMNLISPRPLLVDYFPLYNKIQKKRHFVKPGITGWAQVNGQRYNLETKV
jgi:lipopolysaccharide/colanic/teichoic acid biosynthesis glycosyltransferase